MGFGLVLLNFRRSIVILPLSSNTPKILHNIAQAPSDKQTGLALSSVPAWPIDFYYYLLANSINSNIISDL